MNGKLNKKLDGSNTLFLENTKLWRSDGVEYVIIYCCERKSVTKM